MDFDNLYVLIATAGRPSLLRSTLHSLVECHKPSVYKRTLIIENGPKCGAKAIVNQFKDKLSAQYLYVERSNKSHALNVALQHLDDGLIFFTDDDVHVHPDALKLYSEAATECTRSSFFGGPVEADYEKKPPAWLTPHLPGSAAGWAMGGIDQEKSEWFIGVNWAAFRSDLLKAGAFNPDVGPGSQTGSTGQETDMQQRLIELDIQKIFLPDAIVHHHVPAKRSSAWWALKRVYRNGIKMGMAYDLSADQSLIFGYPKWMFSVPVKVYFRHFLSSLFTGDRSSSFGELVKISRHLGLMKGFRISKSSDAK